MQNSYFFMSKSFASKKFGDKKKWSIFALAITQREFSSAGSEHLPYKQRVGGSNPSTPTNRKSNLFGLLFLFVGVFLPTIFTFSPPFLSL